MFPIDTEATQHRFVETGRTVAAWARAKGFAASTVGDVIRGSFPQTGKVGIAIVKALEADDLLVIREDDDE